MLHITYRNTVGLPPFPSSTPLFMDDGIDTALMGPSSVCGVWGVCSCHLTFFNTLSHFCDCRSRHYLISQGVRTKTVKKSARTIVEKYYPRLTLDFHTNKRIIAEIAITPSKRMRNKIAGFTTHLMKRIAKGPVRNISLKLQEEERERRLDFVPEVSALEQETIKIDRETRDLLESLGFGNMNGVVVSSDVQDTRN